MSGLIYFAIGDIHGEAGMLAELHGAILDRAAFEGGRARIVHLGDYVDRGPDSRGVIERIMALEARGKATGAFDVISLLGNHEDMMLRQLAGGSSINREMWMNGGGEATIRSYVGKKDEEAFVREFPEAHRTWLSALPTLYHNQEQKLAFVHAGIEPAVFPDCETEVRLWTRSSRFMNEMSWPDRPELKGLTVVHGHTPTPSRQPDLGFRRINIDTGACFGGPLTAVMLKPDSAPTFLYAR